MTTTIAVRADTLNMLKAIKEEMQASSFDETIVTLILKAKQPKRSMFGKFKNLPAFKREKIDRFEPEHSQATLISKGSHPRFSSGSV